MSLFPAGGADSVPQIFQLDLKGHFEAGKEKKGKEERKK